MTTRGKPVLNAFAITFGDRWPEAENLLIYNDEDTDHGLDPGIPLWATATLSVMVSMTLEGRDGLVLDAVLHGAVGSPAGCVVLVHGIAADMDEGGMYVRLAEQFAATGLMVLRFSFRGHGRSSGSPRGITVGGELIDVEAALAYAAGLHARVGLVVSSFGAVATALSLPQWTDHLVGVAWWNPVLDVTPTFLEPTLPWGRANFGRAQLASLAREGSLWVDGEFELGPALFTELPVYGRRPYEAMVSSSVPALVVHGDRDTAVPYDIAAQAAAEHPDAVLHTVVGADHGFDGREGAEDEAIAVTVEWMSARFGVACAR